MRWLAWGLGACQVVACVDEPELTSRTQADTVDGFELVCAQHATALRGIDVSHHQGAIDWAAVKGDGITFAFARVSDGTATPDTRFAANWAGMKAAGVVRGAYQYFRPYVDVTAQANLMIEAMADLGPGDLPPVLDVENNDGGQSAAAITAAVQTWVAQVEAATGRRPIIYTGPYFWRDTVGAPDLSPSLGWIADYNYACPRTPAPWEAGWTFHQDSADGSVAGIDGPVDTDWFDGTLDDLLALTGTDATCGDDVCAAGETPGTCPIDCPPCGVIAATGGTVDDGDACFAVGGPLQYIRVEPVGADGDLRWTHTIASDSEANFADWDLYLADAGRYLVEAYTDAAIATSQQARYVVRHGTPGEIVDDEIVLDQTAADGWQALGEFEFAAGAGQRVHLGDNTGEPGADEVVVVFDGVRLTRLDLPPPDDDDGGGDATDGGGCASSRDGAGGGLLVAIALGGLRRRRRP